MGHLLVLKSMHDRKHVVFCGNLLQKPAKQETPCPSLLQCHAGLAQMGRERHKAYTSELGTDSSGSNLALGDTAVHGHGRNRQPCRRRWLRPKRRSAELGAAAGHWTWLLDLSPQGACGKAAGPGPVPVQRDCMETDRPKILLRHFQAPIFT